MLGFFKNWRRKRLLKQPFSEEWREILEETVRHYRLVSEEQRARLERLIRYFVAEKTFEGCDGLQIREEMKVTIAGFACLLLLGREGDYCFDEMQSVLVYPRVIAHLPFWRDRDSGLQRASGEYWDRTVALSWRDVRGDEPGRNVVVHEFAHFLDELSGEGNGIPPQGSEEQWKHWKKVLEEELDQLQQDFHSRAPSVLDYYGTKNEVEFFAVASESFFEAGAALQAARPELYELLAGFYRLDTATLFPPVEERRFRGAQGTIPNEPEW